MKQARDYMKTCAEDKAGASICITFLKALAICFILGFLLIVLYSVLLVSTSLSDATMAKAALIITIFSVCVSAIYGSKRAQKKGWLFGLLMGLAFTVLLIPITSLFNMNFSLDKYFAAKLVLGSTVGLIGGVIGVNLK